MADVAEAVNRAAAEEQRPPVQLATTTQRTGTVSELADFDRLLSIGDKLLRQRQEKALAAESEYQKARTTVLNNCRTQMERLKLITEEELRRLEVEHSKDMREHERTIMALRGLRAGHDMGVR